MNWAKTIKYQASVSFDGELYNVLCEGEDGEDFALMINGEYICDVAELPTSNELMDYVDQHVTLETMARQSFHKRSI